MPWVALASIGGFESGVDEPMGAATYRIPLVTPPGPAGNGPELALLYRSGDGRGPAGWLGFGWRLGGESRIRRSVRHGVPYDYAAGRVCAAGFCYLDAFELDGAGLVCAELGCPDGRYKTRVDDGQRILYLGESGGWTIRDRSGRLHVYGASATHRLLNPANGQIHTWLLERIEDVNGNWIAYTYDVTPGAAYLRRIDYAQAGSPANRSVELLRVPKPDSAPDYRRGIREEVSQRVERIEVVAEPGGLVTAYALDYAQAPTSGRSLLAKVQRIGADDMTTVPPHVFAYTQREVDPNDGALRGFEDGFSHFAEHVALDFTGLLGRYGAEGLLDLNGDAIVDYYRASSGIAGDEVQAFLSNGEDFEPDTQWLDEYLRFWWSESAPEASGLTQSTFDIDGDGRADHVEHGSVRLGAPGGFGAEIPWSFGPDETPSGSPTVSRPPGPQLTWSSDDDVFISLVDMTGDARPDRVHCKHASQVWASGQPGWRVYRNTGLEPDGAAGAFSDVAIDWPDPMGLPCGRGSYSSQALQQTPVDVATIDVNGDGLPDHLRSGVHGMYVAFNNGAGFDPEERALDVAYRTDLKESAGAGHWYAQLLDVNGDGFLDHVGTWVSWAVQMHFGPIGTRPFWAVYFGSGRGFESTPVVFRQCRDPYYPDPDSTECDNWIWEFTSAWSSASHRVTDFADFNGDGLLDRFYRNAALITLNAGPVEDLLTSATTPLGAQVSFEYGSSGRMKLSGSPANPKMASSRPVVVEHALLADPNGPPRVDGYHYAGGVFDSDLRMFLGFAEVERSELGDGADLVVRTSRAVDPGCHGRVEHVESRSSEGVLREEARGYLRISGEAGWHACLLAAETEWSLEGQPASSGRARRTEYAYGPAPEETAYNAVRVDALGAVDPVTLVDVPGDERSTHFTWSPPNAELNLVSKLAERWVEDPSDYDGLPPGTAPTGGALTAVERWFENPHDPNHVPGWVTMARLEYDAFGNPLTRERAPHETATGTARVRQVTVRESIFATFPVAHALLSDDPNAPVSVTSLDYQTCGLLVPPPALGLACVRTGPDGVATSRGFDPLGRLVRIDHPGGPVETRAHGVGPIGSLVVTTLLPPGDPPLVFREWFHALGRRTGLEGPGKLDETVRVDLAYDARGRIVAESDPYRIEPGDPVRTRRYGYDALGRLASRLEPDAETAHTWTRSPWTTTHEVRFDGERQSLAVRSVDAFGRLAALTRFVDAAGATDPVTASAAYDLEGRLVRIDDAIANGAACAETVYCPTQRHSTFYAYDSLGSRVRVEHPDSGLERRRYDAAGLEQTRIDANGAVVSTRHDALGRVAARDHGGNEATFQYFDVPGVGSYGRLRRVAQHDSDVSYDYEYDAFGRLTRIEQQSAGLRFVHEYARDALGRVASQTFPDGETYSHHYDGTRLVGIERAGSGGFEILMAADYDASGRATRLEIGGTHLFDPTSPAVRLERDYDPATGRIIAMRAKGRGGETRLDLGYELDGLGRVTSLDARRFGYDGLGRLVSAAGPWEQPQANGSFVTWTYSYDALGNLRAQESSGVYSRSWRYEDPQRPGFLTRFRTSVAGIPHETRVMTPDAAGNPARIDGERLEWNAMNRLAYRGDPWSSGVRYYDAFGSPVVRWFLGTELIRVGADFEYDTGLLQGTKAFFVNGERIASRAVAYDAESAAVPAWLYHPWMGLLAGSVTLLAIAAWLRVRGRTTLVPAWVGNGVVVFALVLHPVHAARGVIGNGGGPEWHGGHGRGLLVYANDALGSTRAVLDANGEAVETRDYAPYGMTIAHDGAFDLKHRFTGRPHDDRIGLYDYGARMYEPAWGRFLTPDGIRQPSDPSRANAYAYVRDQPTSLVDPDGRVPIAPIVAGASVLVGGTALVVARLSDDPEVDRAATVIAAGAAFVGLSALLLSVGAPPSDAGLFMHIIAANLGIANFVMESIELSRSLSIRTQGVDASTFSGQRGGVRKIEIRDGTSIHDIQKGRIEFGDGSAVEIESGEVVESDQSGNGPSPAPPSRDIRNTGREGRVGSHSLHAVGAHGGGNLAQTQALQGWIAEGGGSLPF
jgi:RHS repeat-associated protein